MDSKGKRLGGDRLTIGLLVDWIDGDYQMAVAEGVFSAARERGANLVCFAGGVLGMAERGGALRHHAFELASPETLSALIVMGGAIGNRVGPEAVAAYCERFRPLPMVSIAADLPGVPSVLVDNEAGMRDVVLHMLRVHGNRRIAFIRGPEANEEAERRYLIYREALEDAGIAIDPALVVVGDFLPESGARAIATLFDERKLSPGAIEAIVAANDNMALGALRELERRQIRVPEQIALAGFDDLEEVRYTNPTLTTVRQPLFEQGKQAVQVAMDLLNDAPPPPRTVLRTELVTRRSCRCFMRVKSTEPVRRDLAVRDFEAALVMRRDLILADMTRAAQASLGPLGQGWELRLLNAFTAELRGDAGDPFLEAFDDATRRMVNASGNARVLSDVLIALRRQVLRSLAQDAPERDRAEEIFQDAQLALGEALERAQAHRRLALQQRARTLGEVTTELALCTSRAELARVLGEVLPRLDVGLCFVALYEDETRQRARIGFVYDAGRKLEVPEESFPVRELAPPGLLPATSPYSVVVEPLFFGDASLGYLVIEFGRCERAVFTTLPALVSAVLKDTSAKRPDPAR